MRWLEGWAGLGTIHKGGPYGKGKGVGRLPKLDDSTDKLVVCQRSSKSSTILQTFFIDGSLGWVRRRLLAVQKV